MRSLKSLRVYGASVDYSAAVSRFLASASLPQDDAEQLRSSVKSVGNNIAEGYGRGPGKDRRRIYRIALGEAMESLNQLRGMVNDGLMPKSLFYKLFSRGRAITKMLAALIADGDPPL
jgi:four helix bundle protein